MPDLIVHTFGPAWNTIDLSPFSVKLQTWLRLARLPFTTRLSIPSRMPQGKLPVLDMDGQRLPDSTAIINALRERHGDPLGDWQRTPEQRALARAVQSMLETDLYFTAVWWRWTPPGNQALLRAEMAHYFQALGVPKLLAPLAFAQARKGIQKQLQGQGAGRKSPEELTANGEQIMSALRDCLGEQPFLLGDAPATIDATGFAFLHTLLNTPLDIPLKTRVLAMPTLVAYHQRMLALCWPERVA